MAWLGMIILVLHYLAPEAETIRTLHGFFKWIALMVGALQGIGFLTATMEATPLTQEQHMLLLAWSVSNIAAFFVIRDAEKKRAEGRKEMSK